MATDDNSAHSNGDNGDEDAPKGGRPGPVDEGKDGGMATREIAPEIAEDN